MSVSEKLQKVGEQLCDDVPLADVRIGLGYTYVELQDGKAGIAWTPGRDGAASCTHLPRAGKLQECSESEALGFLAGEGHLERAIGLATFNAVNSRVKREVDEMEAIARLEIQPADRVVMVGHFAPLIARIKKSGCQLDVLELNTNKPALVDLRDDHEILAECDVAIITSTSIINNTVEGLLRHLQQCRAAVMLGPSTPICPEAFQETGITQLSGSVVCEAEQVKKVISEGGGTMLMKKHLQFVNISV